MMLISNLFLLIPIIVVPMFTYAMMTRQVQATKKQFDVHAVEERRERDVVSELLASSNKQVAAVAKEAADKTMTALSEIHILVNSNLTQAQERELGAARANLASIREVIALKQGRKMPISKEATEAIAVLETQIAALSADLRVKHDATDRAEAVADAAADERPTDG